MHQCGFGFDGLRQFKPEENVMCVSQARVKVTAFSHARRQFKPAENVMCVSRALGICSKEAQAQTRHMSALRSCLRLHIMAWRLDKNPSCLHLIKLEDYSLLEQHVH